MRKWLLALAFIIIAAFISIYVFIPANLDIVQITPVRCTINAAYRQMAASEKWALWSLNRPDKPIRYHYDTYHITRILVNTVEVHISHQNISLNSIIHLLPLPGDSSAIEWKCSFSSGYNPFKRIQRYQQAIDIKKNMAGMLARFQTFVEKTQNVYGIAFHESSTKDTLLIATKTVLPAYPSTPDIYKLVDALKKYTVEQQAQQTGSPICNITKLDKGGFQLMAALPVNKRLPDKGPFFKRWIPAGKFLVTQVKGSEEAIQYALNQLQLYIQDYHRVAMAIPFQQMITDRMAEPDSTKWVTSIYIPVF
jgi:predicted transcriptional regulator YdeE